MARLRKQVKKQECYPRHPIMQEESQSDSVSNSSKYGVYTINYSVLLITYLIKNIHIMAGVRGCSNRFTKTIYNQQETKEVF